MSPHPGYGMTSVQAEYPSNTYTPYPTAGYQCASAYPGGSVTPSYQIPAGYTSAPCYSMPPPQHTIGSLDKSGGKEDRYGYKMSKSFNKIFSLVTLLYPMCVMCVQKGV